MGNSLNKFGVIEGGGQNDRAKRAKTFLLIEDGCVEPRVFVPMGDKEIFVRSEAVEARRSFPLSSWEKAIDSIPNKTVEINGLVGKVLDSKVAWNKDEGACSIKIRLLQSDGDIVDGIVDFHDFFIKALEEEPIGEEDIPMM